MKKLISAILIIAIVFSLGVTAFAADTPVKGLCDEKLIASSWAEPTIKEAVSHCLPVQGQLGMNQFFAGHMTNDNAINLKANATRAEFAGMVGFALCRIVFEKAGHTSNGEFAVYTEDGLGDWWWFNDDIVSWRTAHKVHDGFDNAYCMATNGEWPFTDLINLEWGPYFGTAVLYQLGIVNGTSATTFGPNNSVTREQAAVMIAGAAKALGIKATANNNYKFKDNISGWAQDAVKFCYNTGLVSGYNDTNFGAKDPVTCEQSIVMAMKLFNTANK